MSDFPPGFPRRNPAYPNDPYAVPYLTGDSYYDYGLGPLCRRLAAKYDVAYDDTPNTALVEQGAPTAIIRRCAADSEKSQARGDDGDSARPAQAGGSVLGSPCGADADSQLRGATRSHRMHGGGGLPPALPAAPGAAYRPGK